MDIGWRNAVGTSGCGQFRAAHCAASRVAAHVFEARHSAWEKLEGAAQRSHPQANLHHSCGAASLITLLDSFYGQNVTVEALLKATKPTRTRGRRVHRFVHDQHRPLPRRSQGAEQAARPPGQALGRSADQDG